MGRNPKVKGGVYGKPVKLLSAHQAVALAEKMAVPTRVPTERELAWDKAHGGTGKPVGKKADSGKPPLTMGVLNYFPNALLAVAGVSAYGAKKYELDLADKNWMLVPSGLARYSDALGRHLVLEAIGPTDEESGLYHDAMAAWNALARLELRIKRERDTVNTD